MINNIFEDEIGEMMEVYTCNMMVKSSEAYMHERHLTIVYNCVWKYNMRLNSKKWTFSVKVDKFLIFYWTKRDIEVNPNMTQRTKWIPQLQRRW